VKPRVERVHFVEKSNTGSLEDFFTGKLFLQKNKGVKQKINDEQLRKKMEESRQRRTFSKQM